MTTRAERAAMVRETMESSNVDEATARFMVAIDLGEIPGDVIAVNVEGPVQGLRH